VPSQKTISVVDENNVEIGKVVTPGYLIFYLNGEKIRTIGDMDISALAPIIMKLAMERMAKG